MNTPTSSREQTNISVYYREGTPLLCHKARDMNPHFVRIFISADRPKGGEGRRTDGGRGSTVQEEKGRQCSPPYLCVHVNSGGSGSWLRMRVLIYKLATPRLVKMATRSVGLPIRIVYQRQKQVFRVSSSLGGRGLLKRPTRYGFCLAEGWQRCHCAGCSRG